MDMHEKSTNFIFKVHTGLSLDRIIYTDNLYDIPDNHGYHLYTPPNYQNDHLDKS